MEQQAPEITFTVLLGGGKLLKFAGSPVLARGVTQQNPNGDNRPKHHTSVHHRSPLHPPHLLQHCLVEQRYVCEVVAGIFF